MKVWQERIPAFLPFLFAVFIAAFLGPAPAAGQVFKWVDENEVAHYTSNRASIPIKYQDTVKIVEADTRSNLFQTREVPLPGTGTPGLQEEYLPPEPASVPRKTGTDVVGGVLETPEGAGTPQGAARPAEPRGRPARTARLGLKSYTGKGEGWWRARFSQAGGLVEKQQRIVDAHRNQLRKIIKSHASGNEVVPLEDDAKFQKMARVLPREESRLNKFKRDLRRLEARADELRIPDDWRR
ncbi:MAG: DUF4124 domain-containing protein [Myxococcota bacterium]